MARFVSIQTNFSTGELDPLLRARVDLAAYQNALEEATNVVCQPQGGIRRRPGTKYISSLPNTSTESAGNGTRLVEFEFSTSDSYMLCFTHNRMHVFKNKALITNINGSGNNFLDTSALGLTGARLANIVWTQSADTLIVTHPDVALDDAAVEIGSGAHVLHSGLGEVHRHGHVLGGFARCGVGDVVVHHGHCRIDGGDGVGDGFFKCGAGVYECHGLDPLEGNIIAAAEEAQTACAFGRSNEYLWGAFFVEAGLQKRAELALDESGNFGIFKGVSGVLCAVTNEYFVGITESWSSKTWCNFVSGCVAFVAAFFKSCPRLEVFDAVCWLGALSRGFPARGEKAGVDRAMVFAGKTFKRQLDEGVVVGAEFFVEVGKNVP